MHFTFATGVILARLLGASAAGDSSVFVRVNQLGYLPNATKVAVACVLDSTIITTTFEVRDVRGKRVLGPAQARAYGAFGPCTRTYRMDFSRLTREGRYRVLVNGAEAEVRIASDTYRGVGDSILVYMRQQRSGWNPLFRDSVHRKDGLIVDDSARNGQFIPVTGGWADAADYLQYVTTSATATFHLLAATRDHPRAFSDAYDARGMPGRNGTGDALDEARHGLEWLVAMFPNDTDMYNQLGDDRDHAFWDTPVSDSSDYGWGKGGPRPVYPCTGRPQGLFAAKNRATGKASTAGKMAGAFALGAQLYAKRDASFAAMLRHKAIAAYRVGQRYPGACQTAPGRSPYFYEEDDWADDMELGAAELFALTGDVQFRREAIQYASQAPVKPWMGADTARHYQWYPWHNAAHYELAMRVHGAERDSLIAYYRRGLEAVERRAQNGFRVGVPFIWCSNDLMVSLASHALLYRRLSGDRRFVELEQSAIDWVLGANPWGVSMIIGVPSDGVYPRDTHSEFAREMKLRLTGGLVDGPVYRSIYSNLKGIRLLDPDEYARFNTGAIVYHDDLGDYSTNEHIMDGSANAAYLLSAMAEESSRRRKR